MRCNLCKKGKTTVHITHDPKPGDIVRIHLCSACAKKQGIDDTTGFSLADLLFAFKNNSTEHPRR